MEKLIAGYFQPTATATAPTVAVAKDEKDVKATPERMKSALMHVMTNPTVKGVSKSYPVRLFINGSTTSAANTNNVFSIAVAPGTSSEFSSLAALFNEVRIVGAKLSFFTSVTIGSSATPTFAVVCHDPNNSSALTSVQAGLEFSSNKLYALGTSSFPAAENANGLYVYTPKMPKGVLSSNLSSTAVVSRDQWTPTSSSGTTCGYIKVYVPAVGAAVASTFAWYMAIDCEFRVRQ